MAHIFHPTDQGPGSGPAFAHALRIATRMRAELTLMHVTGHRAPVDVVWPEVGEELVRWGLLERADDVAGLHALGVTVHRVVGQGDPIDACVAHLAATPTDLIVLATHQKEDRIGWVQDRVAEPLARESGRPTLFVPHDRPGFVDADTGIIRLHHVLVPVTTDPDPWPALQEAARLVGHLCDWPVRISLLHVGDGPQEPARLPQAPGVEWHTLHRPGEVVNTIVAAAETLKADLVVMRTKGHDGFLDVLRGNTTEQVLRRVKCPVLGVM